MYFKNMCVCVCLYIYMHKLFLMGVFQERHSDGGITFFSRIITFANG